jgi:poly(3-hydroxybutyrate) depolymerase
MNGRAWLFARLAVLVACVGDDAPASDGSEADVSGSSSDAVSGSETTSSSDSGTSTSSAASSEGSTGDPIPDACIDDPSPGDHVYACDGLTYDVRVPEACLQEACGLIVDVHGYTMSGLMEDANTNLRELGSERGYIVVQPNATPAPPAASWEPATDDDKVFDFMMRAIAVFGVDEDRVHFTGFSQGGWMSWRFACAHADVLASVAPAAACGMECDFETSVPAQPLAILYMHGTADALVNYACAEPLRDAAVEAFGLGAETVVEEGEGYRWTRHEGDTTLEFIRHDYVAEGTLIEGHCFPGSDDPGDAPGQLFSFACSGDNAFHWGEAIIDFFEANPRTP